MGIKKFFQDEVESDEEENETEDDEDDGEDDESDEIVKDRNSVTRM